MPKTIRGPSAKSLLKLTWEYPVYTAPKEDRAGQTVAAKQQKALPREQALAFIAGKDPRPLLVLRECKTCNGTDDALLSRGNVDNERTFLLSRWFHCVKLPVDVLQPEHPFHNLFDSKDPEHMFIGTADGALHLALESERSRVELWDTMMTVLKASYAAQAESLVRKMEKTIDEFDRVDDRLDALEQEVDKILETEGPDSRKLKKVKDELAAAQKQRDTLFRAIDQATAELKLKKAETAKDQASAVAPKGS
ncbi:MAG: hypothetical protein IT454_18225 [Planctomycetes bacterium]|nr:hypothetical protein [Planctomycetota bacterium]